MYLLSVSEYAHGVGGVEVGGGEEGISWENVFFIPHSQTLARPC